MKLFDCGITPHVLAMLVAVAIGLSVVLDFPETAMAAPVSRKTTTATPSFSMRFRSEPNHPRKKDMKIEKLNRLIGSDYNEFWMSKTTKITTNENMTGLNDMSRIAGPDNLQFPEQLPVQYQEMMRTWLVHRSSCQVEYSWTDLGKSFWPRWIKKGRCGSSEMMSCSWPPGMACMPSSIRVLNLLRWHCWLKKSKNNKRNHQGRQLDGSMINNKTIVGRTATEAGRVGLKNKKKKDNKFRCLWIKVPYPVTEDCMCSCRKFDDQ